VSLFLGIDGGGTKTTCAIGDDVSVLAIAKGPGSNVVRLGQARAVDGLRASIAQACAQAGVSPLRVESACIGAAGAANVEVNSIVLRAARQIIPNAEITVVGDMVIAMESALHGLPGAVVIAGTGSIAYGRNSAGETARAGGWGFRVSDEGSGHWIGRGAVAAALRAHDEERETVLLKRILMQWRLDSRDALVQAANASVGPDFSELFPVVQQAAQEGDPVAGKLLSRAGAELASLALIVLQRLWPSGGVVRAGVAGGVFANSIEVRRAFYHSLRAAWPRVAVCFQIAEPVAGALWIARQPAVKP
jgi:N-acetylglucosamine kinase-like BadF-type ATPase